jgi:hypothetical protein
MILFPKFSEAPMPSKEESNKEWKLEVANMTAILTDDRTIFLISIILIS